MVVLEGSEKGRISFLKQTKRDLFENKGGRCLSGGLSRLGGLPVRGFFVLL